MSALPSGVRYSLATVVVGAVVVVAGIWIAGAGSGVDVVLGAAVAVAVQVGIYWTLFVWALPHQQGTAYALGVLVRLVSVAAMAFVGLGSLGLAPAPTLLSMVACLFGSTVLEALFLQRRRSRVLPTGAVTMR